MEGYNKELKIPEERVPVLIGAKGSVKKQLETEFDAKIFINNDGIVSLSGPDSLKIWTCEKIIKAIGRGFNPKLAILLKQDDYDFELFSLKDYSRSKNDIHRLKGRVIGREGVSQKMIEDKTGAYITVYGKTVGIIAGTDVLRIVHNAVEMLLQGARHVTVYKYIDKENQKRMRKLMFNE
ncbi:RNA-processing protein [archaeon CG07_land_8_20_14_0_80_38_8]|nr:MAG: RNA-processing protein [archaeon CG07_land_8_20_14_0_80_38_8]PIU89228.1 MAG: RNA-processing protein [archaeon CG06_land_8_20_14_3_00_37_11]